jgi:hypothetical protein
MPNFPLTVQGPQAPSYSAPLLDFSPLADLPNKFFQGAQNKSAYDASQALKGGIPLDADGQPDYAKAAQILAQTGNIDAVSKMAQIGALTTKTLPPGYRRGANGGYEAIPGGPADPAVISQTAAAGQKPTFSVVAKDQFGNDVHGFVDPTTKKVFDINGKPLDGTNLPGGAGGGDPSLTGDDYLKTLPPGRAAQVKALVEGRMPPPTSAGLRSPATQALLQAAGQYEPGFDLTTWNARNKGYADFYGGGKSSEMVRSANQTISHVGELVSSMMGLDPTSFPSVNSVKNAYNTATGGGQVTEFLPNAHAVADELSKVFKGASISDSEIRSWEQRLNPNMSPEQQKAAVGKLLSLLNGSLTALENKRVQSFGQAAADKKGPLLTPESNTILENVSKWIGGSQDVNAATFKHPLVKPKTGTDPHAQPGQQPAAPAPAGGAGVDPLAQARDAIAKGAPKAAVIDRLKQNGIDPAGL